MKIFNLDIAGMSLVEFISNLYYTIITISGFVIFASIVYGGFLILTSTGNVSQTKEGRTRISDGITGSIIVLASWLIIFTINPSLTIISTPDSLKEDYRDTIVTQFKPDTKYYYQIPVGVLINRAVFDEDGKKKMDDVEKAVNETAEAATRMADESQALNDLVQSFNCGGSKCGDSQYGGDCSGIKCLGPDLKPAITKKISFLEDDVLPDFIGKYDNNLGEARTSVSEDLSNLNKAGKLVSLAGPEIMHHNYAMHELKNPEPGTQVDIATYQDWPQSGQEIVIDNFYNYIKGDYYSKLEDPFTFYLDYDQFEEGVKEILYSEIGYGSGGQGSYSGKKPPVPAEGFLGWPVSNPCFAGGGDFFGVRIHPIYGTATKHNGIDVYDTKRWNYGPIYAPENGTISWISSDSGKYAAGG